MSLRWNKMKVRRGNSHPPLNTRAICSYRGPVKPYTLGGESRHTFCAPYSALQVVMAARFLRSNEATFIPVQVTLHPQQDTLGSNGQKERPAPQGEPQVCLMLWMSIWLI